MHLIILSILKPCLITLFITPILKSLVVPVIWLALIDAIYSQIAPFFPLNRIFFPANEQATLKNKTANQIWRLVQSNRSNCRKMKDKEYHVANFATFVDSLPTLTFSTPENRWI